MSLSDLKKIYEWWQKNKIIGTFFVIIGLIVFYIVIPVINNVVSNYSNDNTNKNINNISINQSSSGNNSQNVITDKEVNINIGGGND